MDRLEQNGNIPVDKSNCRYGGKFEFIQLSVKTNFHIKKLRFTHEQTIIIYLILLLNFMEHPPTKYSLKHYISYH